MYRNTGDGCRHFLRHDVNGLHVRGDLVAATATGSVGWARSIALRSMAATMAKQLPAPWVAALQKLLEGQDAEAMRQALATVRSPAVAPSCSAVCC